MADPQPWSHLVRRAARGSGREDAVGGGASCWTRSGPADPLPGDAIDQILEPAMLLTGVRLPDGRETTFGDATEAQHRAAVRALADGGHPIALHPMAQRHAFAADVLADVGAASLNAHLARRAV